MIDSIPDASLSSPPSYPVPSFLTVPPLPFQFHERRNSGTTSGTFPSRVPPPSTTSPCDAMGGPCHGEHGWKVVFVVDDHGTVRIFKSSHYAHIKVAVTGNEEIKRVCSATKDTVHANRFRLYPTSARNSFSLLANCTVRSTLRLTIKVAAQLK